MRYSILVLILLAVGCGGPSRPATAPVCGHVTYQGKPVPLGQIVFYPEKGRPAMGAIGGRQLSVDNLRDRRRRAVPGRYQVTIQAMRTIGGGARPKTLEEELHGVGRGFGQVVTEWLVPEKFARQETTPLTAKVKLGPNTINFDLPGP